MFEGDPLLLRCQAWQDWPLAQVTFYRDGSALGPPGPDRQFPIAAAREADSGRYHCGAVFRSPRPGSPEEASPVAITVQGESSGRRGGGRHGWGGTGTWASVPAGGKVTLGPRWSPPALQTARPSVPLVLAA